MKTKKQEELIASFLSALGDDTKPLYEDLITCLSELGYNPAKERSNISFKHDLHNKQIAKIGLKKNGSPFFALRFSACRDYPQKFQKIVKDYIIKYPTRASRCTDGGCNFCAGEPATHVYTYTPPVGTPEGTPEGGTKTHCGANAIEIPDITPDDVNEIKKLIKEEHAYLLKYQAGIS